MRGVWKVSFQEAARRRQMGFRNTRAPTDALMRMNEALLEKSCLQGFVVPPRSTKQLAWSTIGSFLRLGWSLWRVDFGGLEWGSGS